VVAAGCSGLARRRDLAERLVAIGWLYEIDVGFTEASTARSDSQKSRKRLESQVIA
jgi:hypothetical protein